MHTVSQAGSAGASQPQGEAMRYAGQMSSSSGSGTRARIGKWLVGIAVLVPALLVVGLYLYLQGNLVGHRVHGPLWPWISADAAVLAIGMLLLRGQEL